LVSDRPLMQRVAASIRDWLVGAPIEKIHRDHRLTVLLFDDARHAFTSHAEKSGQRLAYSPALDEFILDWTRQYLADWSVSREPSPRPGPDPNRATSSDDTFVGEMGVTPVEQDGLQEDEEEPDDSYGALEDAPTPDDARRIAKRGQIQRRRRRVQRRSEVWREPSVGQPIGSVLIVEDESFRAVDYGRTLNALGFDVTYAASAAAALEEVTASEFDIVVIDIRMPNRPTYEDFEAVNGYRTGVLLASDLANSVNVRALVALTNSSDALDEQWFLAREEHFCSKEEFPPDRFARFLAVNVMRRYDHLKCFIVHGRSLPLVRELQRQLQAKLKLREATVLWEAPSAGQTIVEKFEYHARTSDLVFVLVTADETRPLAELPAPTRPNVLFETGYFYALFGRRSGRVILLHQRGVEFPSDLDGVIYVDITDGIESAWPQIESELTNVFGSDIQR
jgi:CheY-like chemotaxis protein